MKRKGVGRWVGGRQVHEATDRANGESAGPHGFHACVVLWGGRRVGGLVGGWVEEEEEEEEGLG